VLGTITHLQPSVLGLAFWVIVVCTSLLHFFRERELDAAKGRSQVRLEESQARLEASAQSLQDLVRTLPPDGFLDELAVSHEASLVLTANAGSAENFSAAAVFTIRAIASLCKRFDESGTTATYAANVMTFVSKDRADAHCEYLLFTASPRSLDGLRGVLLLIPELSANTAAHDRSDETLQPLCLPVPLNARHSSGGPYLVLPGAPFTYLEKTFSVFPVIADLIKWCEERCDLQRHVKNSITEYFNEKAAHIGGLLCIPLRFPTESAEGEIQGVLNVHWSTGQRLRDEHAAFIFSQSLAPLTMLLSWQVRRLQELGEFEKRAQ
jgi:hypothetical protein